MYQKSVSHVQLIQAIFSEFWLINQNSAMGYLPFIKALLDKNFDDLHQLKGDFSQASPLAISANGAENAKFDEAPPKSKALIQIVGPLTKYDGWCNYGMETMGKWIRDADAHENINAIILKVDSPGGQAKGSEEFSQIIASTKKPVVAFVSGEACSAAYYAISGANHIKLSGSATMVGSIGTQFSMIDARPVLEEMGYKFHDIRASKSVDKNQEFFDMLKGNYDAMRENFLDPLNEVFIQNVTQNRPIDSDNEPTTGKVYFGQKAIDAKLADSIGTMEEAIQLAEELALQQSQNHSITFNQDQTMPNFLKDLYDKVTTKAKAEGREATSEELEAEAAKQVDALTEQNQALQQQASETTAALQENQSKVEELMQKFEALQQQNAQLTKENEELGKKTTATPVQTTTEKDSFIEASSQVPLLDIEEKVTAQHGVKVDNQSFNRTKGIIL